MSKRPKPKKGKWLRRDIITGPCVKLILSEREFKREMRRLGYPDAEFLGNGHARTHSFTHKGEPVSIVCLGMNATKSYTMTAIAGVLVHEAMHVWRAFCKFIGEDEPSDEFEAYSVQHIAQQLIHSFREQIGVAL